VADTRNDSLLQLALHFGATVIGTVSSEAKAKVVKEKGAQHVIITTKENVVEEVLKITNGDGVHGIFDSVGKDTFEDNFVLARRKATIVSLGNSSGVVPPFSPLKLGDKNLKMVRPRLYVYIHTPEEARMYAEQYLTLIAQGAVSFTIHGEYPFTAAGVQKAQEDISGRGTIGKLIIKIA